MSFDKKVKTALDELRMLMMGAQILLGFQFQAPFQKTFGHLQSALQMLDLVAVALMIAVIGLLILPNAYHRIVEDGEATVSLQQLIRRAAGTTMLPLATVIGIDVLLTAQLMMAEAAAILVAAAAFVSSFCLWYALGFGRASGRESNVPKDEQGRTSLSAKIEYVLTEARVVLPGAQALLGFQLVIVLTDAFDQLPDDAKLVHAAALSFVTLATILLIAPAAHHRIAFGGEDSDAFHRRASRMLLFSTVALALGIAADAYVVTLKIAESNTFSIAMAVVTAATLIGMWHVWPALHRVERQPAEAPGKVTPARPD
jgi:hypothetical protein